LTLSLRKKYYSPDNLIFHFIILLSNHLFSNHRKLKIFGSISRISVLRAADWIYPTSTLNQHTLAARLARFVIPSIYPLPSTPKADHHETTPSVTPKQRKLYRRSDLLLEIAWKRTSRFTSAKSSWILALPNILPTWHLKSNTT
jgi:hypothetical protein